jgi:predicted ATPase
VPKAAKPQRIPLFGRETALERLTDLTQRLPSGKAVYCVINGQMGIGKSRLKEELVSRLNKSGTVDFFETNCSVDVTSPYYPFKILLRDFLGLHELDSPQTMARQIDDVLEKNNLSRTVRRGVKHLLLTDLGRLRSDEIRTLNEEIYTAMRNLVRHMCCKKPVVLIFDEFEQADLMSRDLITYLSSELEHEPIMFLLVDVPKKYLDAWTVDWEEINLQPLNKKEVNTLIRHMLGNIDESLADYIYRESGGNPLFAIEALRNTRRNKIIKQVSGKWYLEKEQDLVFLDDLYGLVMSTIDSLTSTARLIIDYASVIGYRFSLRILSELLARPDLKEQLDFLVTEGYIVLSSDGADSVYIFRHNLLKDAAYSVLPLRKRKEIHQKVAVLFERLHAENLSPFYEDVGRHYLACDQHGPAARYFKLAGDKAKNLFAIDQALSFYEQVMSIKTRIGDELPEDLYQDVILNLVDIYEIKGDINKMEKTSRKRLTEARQNKELMNEMLFAERDAYALILLNHLPEAEQLLLASVEKCDEQMVDTLAVLYGHLGLLYANRYEYDKCLINYNLSWRIAHANEIREAEILCLLNLANLHKALGNYEKALEYAQYGLEILVDTENIKRNIECQYLIASIEYELWNIEKAESILSECLMTADSIGSFDAYIRSALDLARIHSLNERSDQVAKYLKSVDKKISFLLRENLMVEINLKKAIIYYENKDYQKANDYVISSIRTAERAHMAGVVFQCQTLLSLLDKTHGLEHAKKALTMAELMKLPPLIANALYRVTQIYLELDDVENARYYGKKALLVYDDIKSRLSETNRKYYINRPEYASLLGI